MLVLSRKETERVRLGDSIVITVVRVAGDKVRLGIEAPAEMRVLRDELAPRVGQAFQPDTKALTGTVERSQLGPKISPVEAAGPPAATLSGWKA